MAALHGRGGSVRPTEVGTQTLRELFLRFGVQIDGKTEKEKIMTKPAINVTPLIDVLLVLLIIFMVVSPMKPSTFNAKVPRQPTKDNRVIVNPDTLVVSITPDNSLNINHEHDLGTVDDPQKTIQRLTDIFRLRTESYIANALGEASAPKLVFIKAPRGLNYGAVAKVVDAVKASGANPISLQIDDLE